MSSPQRRKELSAIREQQERERYEEQIRVANLSLFSRIDELSVSQEVKDVLIIIAERSGVDIWE